MLKYFLSLLKKYLLPSNSKDVATTFNSSNTSKTSTKSNKSYKKLINSKEPSNSRPKKPVTHINKDKLAYKIKTNLFFINDLMSKMETIEEYISYYDKLKTLQDESKNCLKVLLRINTNAPYYRSTASVILKHTNAISELLDE